MVSDIFGQKSEETRINWYTLFNRLINFVKKKHKFQGASLSQLERDIGSEQFPPGEHYFGLTNVRRIKTCKSHEISFTNPHLFLFFFCSLAIRVTVILYYKPFIFASRSGRRFWNTRPKIRGLRRLYYHAWRIYSTR